MGVPAHSKWGNASNAVIVDETQEQPIPGPLILHAPRIISTGLWPVSGVYGEARRDCARLQGQHLRRRGGALSAGAEGHTYGGLSTGPRTRHSPFSWVELRHPAPNGCEIGTGHAGCRVPGASRVAHAANNAEKLYTPSSLRRPSFSLNWVAGGSRGTVAGNQMLFMRACVGRRGSRGWTGLAGCKRHKPPPHHKALMSTFAQHGALTLGIATSGPNNHPGQANPALSICRCDRVRKMLQLREDDALPYSHPGTVISSDSLTTFATDSPRTLENFYTT